MQVLLQVFRRAGTHPVEDVVVPLIVTLHANSGLFQQVMGDESAHNCILETQDKNWDLQANFIYTGHAQKVELYTITSDYLLPSH